MRWFAEHHVRLPSQCLYIADHDGKWVADHEGGIERLDEATEAIGRCIGVNLEIADLNLANTGSQRDCREFHDDLRSGLLSFIGVTFNLLTMILMECAKLACNARPDWSFCNVSDFGLLTPLKIIGSAWASSPRWLRRIGGDIWRNWLGSWPPIGCAGSEWSSLQERLVRCFVQ